MSRSPHALSPQDLDALLADTDSEVSAIAEAHKARLLKIDGDVALSLHGTVTLSWGTVPYALIPQKGVLKHAVKWRSLTPSARLAMVTERLSGSLREDLEREVLAFVRRMASIAKAAKLPLDSLWGGLVEPRALARARFHVVEGRIYAAAEALQTNMQAERSRQTVQLQRYPESFSTAAAMPRKLIALLGPTNSGKTHAAMEHLARAKSGVYLAPLRLLALENYERLAEAGVPVSLVTGEERRIHNGATHVASTVEMLDWRQPVEVAVIDEVQMLEDPDRGSAWTAAICGAPASTVYLVGAASARAAIEALATRLGCPLEVRLLERKSPLVLARAPLRGIGDLKKGDAVIAFSRKAVLYWADMISQTGLSVATIYGNLSPEVRRAQATLFREGTADVVVATDAIGMGLNLPITRCVLTTTTKFDGVVSDTISVAMALQIAGRAGRYGLHESGEVVGLDPATHASLGRLLAQKAPDIPSKGFFVAPTLEHLERLATATGERKLERLLTLFSKHIDLYDEFFLPASLKTQQERAPWLDAHPLTLAQKFLLSLVPLSLQSPHQKATWEQWSHKLAKGEPARLSLHPLGGGLDELHVAEDACKAYSAYAWLAYREPRLFPDGEAAMSAARVASEHVNHVLQAAHPSCRTPHKRTSK